MITANRWHHQAVELIEELGKRSTDITGDSMKTMYLFQQLYQPAIAYCNRYKFNKCKNLTV